MISKNNENNGKGQLVEVEVKFGREINNSLKLNST